MITHGFMAVERIPPEGSPNYEWGLTSPIHRTYMGLSENVGYIPNEIAI